MIPLVYSLTASHMCEKETGHFRWPLHTSASNQPLWPFWRWGQSLCSQLTCWRDSLQWNFSLFSMPDVHSWRLIRGDGSEYREVYNQQAEKQMSIQSEGPPIRVCGINGKPQAMHGIISKEIGLLTALHCVFVLLSGMRGKGKSASLGTSPISPDGWPLINRYSAIC